MMELNTRNYRWEEIGKKMKKISPLFKGVKFNLRLIKYC